MNSAIIWAQVYEFSVGLCTPRMDLQNPATGTYPGFSGHSGGTTMKYGLSPRPDAEAEFLAFTMRNHLLATDVDYARIRQDLASIRQLYPDMQAIEFLGDYVDGELLVTLITPINPLISTEQYDETNRFLGLCYEDRFASFIGFDVAKLSFPARMNMNVLTDLYDPYLMSNLSSISSPNDISGLDDYIRVISVSGSPGLLTAKVDTTFCYEFEDGWLNCFDGCDCKEVYTFETDDSGEVAFVGSVFDFPFGWEQICIDARSRPAYTEGTPDRAPFQ